MKTVVLFGLSAATLLFSLWTAQGATFRWANSSNRIYVENGGSATLSDIKTGLPNAPLDLLDATNKIWLLRANLQIEDGCLLELHGSAAGGDVNELRLQSNNSSNGFISVTADWGKIDIKDTRISSWDLATNGPDVEFQTFGRAFIRVRSRLAADGVTPLESRMDIVNSDISYLGYDASESYGLAWKVVGTHPDSTKSIFDYVNVHGDITGSRLHHNFWGVYTFGLEGAQWLNNEIDHNAGYGLDPHDDSDHLIIEGNDIHHNGGFARGVHGIIASKRCDHIVIRNNRSWANAGNGIMLHRHSDDALVENNTTFFNGDSGIALFDADRTTVRNNLVLSNGNAGIRLSVGCTDSVIAGNEIAYSGGNGVYFYPGTDPAEPDPVDPTVTNRSRRNTMASNYVHHCRAEGIKMTDGDENVLIGNEFSANARELFFLTSTETRFIGNAIPPNAIVALFGTASGPNTTFFEQQPLVTLALSNAYVSATFEDDGGAIFAVGQSSVATRVDNQHSFVTLTTAEIGIGATVTTRDFFAGSDTGEALISVNPTLWGSGGDFRKQWTSQASDATANLRYTIGDLSPNRLYTILKNDQPLMSVSSDSSGQASFTDTPGTTAAIQYAIALTDQPPPLPTVTVVDSDGNAAESGANSGSFRISRSGSTASALTVQYSLSGSASNGADYATLSGSVNIPAGSSSATILVDTIDDSIVEGDENVVLALSSDSAYEIGSPNSARVDIEDNDREPPPPTPTVTVAASDDDASEDGLNGGAFTVSRTGDTLSALTVHYSLGGSATNGLDYSILSNSVTIAVGSSSTNLAVTPIDDNDVEGNESVVLTLSPDPAYTVGSQDSATVIIADNDESPDLPIVTVVDSDGNAAESGVNSGSFRISRSGSTASALTVQYSLSGSASNGGDYATLSGSVNIPAGSSSATILVDTIDDSIVEGDENVVLTLSSDTAYVIGSPNSARVDIEDNDREPPPRPIVSVVASDILVAESGPNSGSFTVSRSGSTAADLTVKYSLSGTAANGTDYAHLSGSVTIRAGNESETVVVQPIDDSLLEIAELVTFTLAGDPSYDVNLLLGTATLSILDNDLLGSDPPVLAISLAGGQPNDRVDIRWNSEAGRRYQLQYKSEWTATDWTNVGSVTTATNESAITYDAIGSNELRFYRLVVLPDPIVSIAP